MNAPAIRLHPSFVTPRSTAGHFDLLRYLRRFPNLSPETLISTARLYWDVHLERHEIDLGRRTLRLSSGRRERGHG